MTCNPQSDITFVSKGLPPLMCYTHDSLGKQSAKLQAGLIITHRAWQNAHHGNLKKKAYEHWSDDHLQDQADLAILCSSRRLPAQSDDHLQDLADLAAHEQRGHAAKVAVRDRKERLPAAAAQPVRLQHVRQPLPARHAKTVETTSVPSNTVGPLSALEQASQSAYHASALLPYSTFPHSSPEQAMLHDAVANFSSRRARQAQKPPAWLNPC